MQRAIRVACKDLLSEIYEILDDLVAVDNLFSISSTDYDVHGHILSTVVVHCTLIRTGHAFVRQVVDHRNKRFSLICKLSEHLTGRKTHRKQSKETDYQAQVLQIKTAQKTRNNPLWSGQNRLGMTKRTANCKCCIELKYSTLQNNWHANVRCQVHSNHPDAKLPAPLTLPSSIADCLNHLKKHIGASVKQQLNYCAENGLDVTQAFTRRLNSSTDADGAFGLSGDSGLLFVLLNMKKKLHFCVEMELTDAANKCHQTVTVACIDGKFVHVQGGKVAPDSDRMQYAGLDARSDDTELKSFYEFLVGYLVRIPNLTCKIRNCVWATDRDLEYLAAHPWVMMFDTTCKTNIRNMHFGYGSGTTTNRNWFKSFSFVLSSLQKRDFFWLWSVGTPAIIGKKIRLQLQQVVTDGDDDMIDAIKGAFAKNAWGIPDVLCRRCIFHLLHLNFEKDYPHFTCDGGVGLKCRDWLKTAGRRCKSKEDMLDAGHKILTFIRQHKDDGNFRNIARERLLAWVTARLMHTDDWCRYAFNHLQCFDIETTSPAEGLHYGLKSDSEVHSHCELSMLAMADLRRTKQLCFENDREAEARALEEATNVRTAVETLLHKHVCSSTAEDVKKEFILSANYQVLKPRSGDDPSVVALVVSSSAPAAASSDPNFHPAPFQITRAHEIMKVGRGLFCDCAAQTVHGRPCRHTLAYNEGLVDVDDFAHFHTKKYLVRPYDGMYSGVCDRAKITRQLPEYNGPAESNDDGDNCNDDPIDGGDFAVSSK
jgi:hypothetical protein